MWLPGTRKSSDRPGGYVRNHYRVPAYIGTRVAYVWPERHGGKRRVGKITGFRGQYLLIKFDDEQRGSRVLYHPTWEIEYLTGGDSR